MKTKISFTKVCTGFIAASFLIVSSVLFASCKKKTPEVQETKDEIRVSVSSYDFFYFSDGVFRKASGFLDVPSIPSRPWTEAVRISSISSAASNEEESPLAYAVVNRVGIISFSEGNAHLHPDAQLFNGRTAGNLVFYNETPVYSLYRSTFFNDMERNFHGFHPFLVQFNPEQKISYPIVNVDSLKLGANYEITDFIWDGKVFSCSAKCTDGEKISFSYLNFQPKEDLLVITPETASNNIFITKTGVESFREAQKIQAFEKAPERVRDLLSSVKNANFMITVRNAGGHTPRRYSNFSSSSDENRYATSDALLSSTWCAAMFQDGTVFLKGALDGRAIFNGGRAVALRLPKLPPSFQYSGFAISGSYLYAAWEESDFYRVARSGFLCVDLGKILYSKSANPSNSKVK